MISTSITTALISLQDQVTAAQPLANADQATIVALQLNAANLVESIEAALHVTSVLDTWMPPSDPQSMIAGVLIDVTAAEDQSKLALMRGEIGRATSNLEQL